MLTIEPFHVAKEIHVRNDILAVHYTVYTTPNYSKPWNMQCCILYCVGYHKQPLKFPAKRCPELILPLVAMSQYQILPERPNTFNITFKYSPFKKPKRCGFYVSASPPEVLITNQHKPQIVVLSNVLSIILPKYHFSREGLLLIIID